MLNQKSSWNESFSLSLSSVILANKKFLFYGLIISHPKMWEKLFSEKNIFFQGGFCFLGFGLESSFPKYKQIFFLEKYEKFFQYVLFFFRLGAAKCARQPQYSLLQEFLFSKMGLTTLSTQVVSIIKAKLWNVLIKYKNNMFFNFQALLYILETMTFFPHLVAIQ